MLQIKKILYSTDFSECAAHALPYAAYLARRYNAELHMLHALVLHEADPGNAAHGLPDMEQLYLVLEEHAQTQIEAAIQKTATSGIDVRRAQIRGISAPGAILDYAAQNDIDLVVMGTHGRRGLRRLLLGSVAEEIVRLAPCPVLTVPGGKDDLRPDQVEQIVVPVDFSEHATLAIGYARELATLYGARLHLLHVVDEVIYPDFYPPVVPSGDAVTEELREQSLNRLRELVVSSGATPSETEVHVRAGRAAPEIASFASDLSADLIALASHGLTGIRHMLLGSVTEQVVRRATCPVFTAKSFGKMLF